jgi:hypothetical protein
MAIDPSIITSGNQMAQIRLPDVNAMMQTRTAGLENMYNIEQQRAAQAQAEQKAQQDALVDALAPAYATAYKGGGTKEAITAGVSLLSPEIQAKIAPSIQKMLAMPSDELRMSALESSLASSGDTGRAILNRIPTEIQRMNADIQRGQLEISKAELAQRRAEANQPEAMTPYQAAQIQIEREKLASTKKTETAEEVKKRLSDEKRIKDLGLAVSELERAMVPGGLIDTATGSYLGNLFDTAAATISFGTEGAQAIARLAPIADLALKMVPRFEGPQSNYDVQSYKDAAGNLSNPNVPASTKRAAADEIVRLFKKYKDQFEYAGDGGAAAGGEAGGNEDPLGIR